MEMEAIIMGLHRYTDQRKILLSAKTIDIRKNNHVSDDQREIKQGTRTLKSPNTQNRHKCSCKTTAIRTPKRKGKANHEAEGEGADDGERDRDGRQLDVADVADKDVGERVGPVLAENVERDWGGDLPHPHGLYPEHRPRLPEASHGRVVPVATAVEKRRLHLSRLIVRAGLEIAASKVVMTNERDVECVKSGRGRCCAVLRSLFYSPFQGNQLANEHVVLTVRCAFSGA